jgi:cobalt-zinc-cadmium efflux system protein
MQQDHDHSGHGHSHTVSNAQAGSNAFRIGLAINLIYALAEAGVGLFTNSLSLLTDAGHNFSDVASLVLSLLGFYLARRPANAAFTYGYRKSTILAALVNAVLLVIVVAVIAYEAVERLGHPQPLPGGTIAWMAGLGIVVNLGSALLFRRDNELNARSAYLHLMADALVSAGVVIAGVVIYFTRWYVIDTIVSLVVCVVILTGTWRLLRDSLRLTLDAVPANVDTDAVRERILRMPGVHGFTHVHIWAMSTTENALTAHLSLDPAVRDPFALVAAVKHELRHLDIHHATLELVREQDADRCPLQKPEL